MTRSEALAPLNTGEGRFTANMTLLSRSSFRKFLLMNAIDFYEEKSLMSSVFIIRGSKTLVKKIHYTLSQMAE